MPGLWRCGRLSRPRRGIVSGLTRWAWADGIIEELDTDGDGRISGAEFAAMFEGGKPGQSASKHTPHANLFAPAGEILMEAGRNVRSMTIRGGRQTLWRSSNSETSAKRMTSAR